MLSLTDLRPVEGPRVDVPIPSQVSQFHFGSNDELLCTDKAIDFRALWQNAWIGNLETGHAEHFVHLTPWFLGGMALTHDGAVLLLGHSQGKITIHQRNSPERFETWDLHWDPQPDVPADRKESIDQLDLTPDGHTLIVRMGDNPGSLRLYDYPTRKPLEQFGTQMAEAPCVLSRSGRWLVSKDGRTGSVCDLRSPVFSARGFSSIHSILALAVSPDESLFASGGDGRTIELRSLPMGAVQKELIGHEALVTALAFSPDGRSLLSGDLAGTVKIWSVETGRFLCDLAHLERKIERIQFSPSGRYLAYSASLGPLVAYDLRRLHAGD
jgi:WD40 repeat protein